MPRNAADRGINMKQGVLLAGEPMALFIAQSEGPLECVDGYTAAIAGAEYNVAVGLRRLEHTAGYLTKLGDDPFGRRIVRGMRENGIGTELTALCAGRPTGFMLKSKVHAGDPEIFYFRKGSAASTLCAADVEKLDISHYGVLHMTGILPALSDSCRTAALALADRARDEGMFFSFDPNLRPQLWPDRETMTRFVNDLAARADLFLPGIAEGQTLAGARTCEEIAAFYLGLGAKTVVVKNGSAGAYACTPEKSFWAQGFPVRQVVDTVGAGDGFAVGVLSGLLEGLPLCEAVRRGNAVGAIQVMSVGDNDGLPTRAQLAAFMEKGEPADA